MFMHDWELVGTGMSGAAVYRSMDGRSFAKTATETSLLVELRDERDRLKWLNTVPVPAPRVLDWQERGDSGTLITDTLPGVPASALTASNASIGARRLVEFLDFLHGLPVSDCPFDRRLATTVPLAAANVTTGRVDETDFDDERQGQTADELLGKLLADHDRAEAGERDDLAVCHGDFCLPNVLFDPDTLTITGVLDVGRLGVADRHTDLALLTRSLASTDLNPGFGPELAAWVSQHTKADPWRTDYYRLLDEFF